jgi:hypothetical protein
MKSIDFDSALDGSRTPERQEKLDSTFGEGGDIISIVGVANIKGREMALARMITPTEVLSFGSTIEVKRDQNNIIFLSNGLLLLGAPWDEGAERFAEIAARVGFFVFEVITPTRMLRALVRLDGNVIDTFEFKIEKDEYEKHLAGFYTGPLEDKGLN